MEREGRAKSERWGVRGRGMEGREGGKERVRERERKGKRGERERMGKRGERERGKCEKSCVFVVDFCFSRYCVYFVDFLWIFVDFL